jgi:hypothetical protein
MPLSTKESAPDRLFCLVMDQKANDPRKDNLYETTDDPGGSRKLQEEALPLIGKALAGGAEPILVKPRAASVSDPERITEVQEDRSPYANFWHRGIGLPRWRLYPFFLPLSTSGAVSVSRLPAHWYWHEYRVLVCPLSSIIEPILLFEAMQILVIY